jgi:uncharacterized protein YdiU (UPF0061 family)
MTVEEAKDALSIYYETFSRHYVELMSAKLGITPGPEAGELITALLEALHGNKVDYTVFFRRLNGFKQAAGEFNAPLRDFFLEREAFDAWAQRYRALLVREGQDDAARKATLDRVNPKYVLRNYMAQVAIAKAQNERDYSEVDALLKLLQRPFDEHPEMERYAGFPPDWAQEISVSCSS